MKREVRIALAQLPVVSLAPEENAERAVDSIRAAATAGADLVVLPELCNTGQVRQFDVDFSVDYASCAETLDGAFLSRIRQAASAGRVLVVVGLAERHRTVQEVVFNSGVVLGRQGGIIGVQRKLHLPGEERHYFAKGTRVSVFDTDVGRLAISICYDLYFPEFARVAALQGSEILVGIANFPHRPAWSHRITQVAAVRAYENMQHVVVVNRVGANHGVEYGGGSVVAEPPGNIVVRAPVCEPDVAIATIASQVLSSERRRRPVFSDRRPELYGEVVVSAEAEIRERPARDVEVGGG